MQNNKIRIEHPTPTKRQINLTYIDRNILWWLTEGDHLFYMQPEDRAEVLRINGSRDPMSAEERRFMRALVRRMGMEPDDLWGGESHAPDPALKPERRYRAREVLPGPRI